MEYKIISLGKLKVSRLKAILILKKDYFYDFCSYNDCIVLFDAIQNKTLDIIDNNLHYVLKTIYEDLKLKEIKKEQETYNISNKLPRG